MKLITLQNLNILCFVLLQLSFYRQMRHQILTSPNFPGYDNNIDVVWHVAAPSGYRIMVHFTEFYTHLTGIWYMSTTERHQSTSLQVWGKPYPGDLVQGISPRLELTSGFDLPVMIRTTTTIQVSRPCLQP